MLRGFEEATQAHLALKHNALQKRDVWLINPDGTKVIPFLVEAPPPPPAKEQAAKNSQPLWTVCLRHDQEWYEAGHLIEGLAQRVCRALHSTGLDVKLKDPEGQRAVVQESTFADASFAKALNAFAKAQQNKGVEPLPPRLALQAEAYEVGLRQVLKESSQLEACEASLEWLSRQENLELSTRRILFSCILQGRTAARRILTSSCT